MASGVMCSDTALVGRSGAYKSSVNHVFCRRGLGTLWPRMDCNVI